MKSDNLSLGLDSFKGSDIEKGFNDNDLEKGKILPVGTITNGYKKGADGKWRPVKKEKTNSFDSEYFVSDDQFVKQTSYRDYPNSVGSLAHTGARRVDDYHMFKLDDFDKKITKDVPLKPNEMIFRFETDKSKVTGMRPLIKVNTKSGLVYFVDNDHFEKTNEIKFEPKSEKVHYMKLRRNDFVAPTDKKHMIEGFDRSRGFIARNKEEMSLEEQVIKGAKASKVISDRMRKMGGFIANIADNVEHGLEHRFTGPLTRKSFEDFLPEWVSGGEITALLK